MKFRVDRRIKLKTSQTKLLSRESVQACHDCYTLEFSLEKACDVIGSVHPVPEMLKAEQSGPITKPLWNGAGQQLL